MANYNKIHVKEDARVELHDALRLTGAEVSINRLPAGGGVPFVHSHRKNEEIYAVLAGSGSAVVDGARIDLQTGDWVRVSPSAKRQFFAAPDEGIEYLCIQVKDGSLEGYTASDAVLE